MLLFQSVPPSPLTVSTSLFSMPGSPLLSCKHVPQYCLSRVHMFSLSRVHVQFSLPGVHEFMSSVPQSCLTPVTPWTAARQASLSFTVTKVCLCSCPLHSWYHSAISWCYFLLLPSIILSIRNFSNKSAFHIRWAKYWSFSFIISPSNEYSELISLKIDWFDHLVSKEPSTLDPPSPAPQFEGINSSALCFLYSLALTAVHLDSLCIH